MVTVVGVRFKQAGKIYYFSPRGLQITLGDGCIVETSRGVEYGEIVIAPKHVPECEIVQPLKEVLRLATEQDIQKVERNRERARDAYQVAAVKIEEHKLPMRLLEAEYTLDDSKLIFSFTAEGRVDFRELVRDLASIFRIRIELRQVGVRDEAKIIGGLGSCGRTLCCASFLGDFEPVSIKMAKDQNLSLNPSKISGVCGRLMCCLRYECRTYEENKQRFGKGAGADVVDEFYDEPEDEPDYYSDLLEEDSIKEVDYQMLVETAEIEKNTRQAGSPRSADAAKKPRRNPKKFTKSESTDQQSSPDKTGSPKRRKRPKRRKPKGNPGQKDD